MLRTLFAATIAFFAAPALAQQTFVLDASACGGAAAPANVLFANGFDVATPAPSSPSNGSGGAYPGPQDRAITLDGATKNYYVHVPTGYDPARPAPVMLVLHGYVGSQYWAHAYAQAYRSDWSATANAGGFIVLAAVGSSSAGTWNGNDYAALDAVLADLASAYNVERTRTYLWGFSAGGHFGHDVVLRNRDRFAAYGVSAGALSQYACDRVGAPSCAQLLAGNPRRVPVDIHIGRSDPLYAAASADVGRFTGGGWSPDAEIRYVEFDGGHTWLLSHAGEVWSYVCRYAVAP